VAVLDLDQTVARASTGVSPARARQLRWVARELILGHASGQLPEPHAVLGDPAQAGAYLRAAQDGTLRTRTSRSGTSSDASLRVRISCLRMLAQAAGFPAPDLELPAAPERDSPPPANQLSTLRGWLERQAVAQQRPRRIRDAAALAVALDAPVRTGALAAARLPDVNLPAATITLDESPPGARRDYDRTTHQLSGSTVAALRRWLEVRAVLVAPRVDALWVSVAGNHRGDGIRTPPGLPLRARGLTRSIASALAEANLALAGTPGWQPLPGRLGGLSRPDEAGELPTVRPARTG
jgi:integrase